jgi:glycosyltransferase involved in cell wall biosynthesis
VVSEAARVTVVIPVWGEYAARVAGAVESALAQEGIGVHAVVVDNASEVPLPPLPEAVEVVRLPARVALGDARNAGLQRAHTPYIFFLDADDRLLPGTLGAQAAVLDADPGIAACSARVLIVNEADGVERRGHWPEEAAVQRSAHERRFALWLLHSAQVPIVSSLIRTDVARDAGGFPDASFFEDWLFSISLAFRGRIAFIERPGLRYIGHDGSLWHRVHSRDEIAGVYRRLRQHIRQDRAVPLWVKAASPLLVADHARTIRMLTPDGVSDRRMESTS